MADATNFLVIISDEHRRDAMGCAGHSTVQTPHLDALAANGTLFKNAYTPCPMCVPARASIATGEPVHRTKCWDSATPYTGTPKSWMHELTANGIDITSIGKLHFRSEKDDTGFSTQILPMHVLKEIGWTIGLLRKDLPKYTSAAELAADIGVGSSSYTDYDLAITSATETWLSEPGRKEKPWASFVSLVSPHYPLRAPEEFYNLYDPQKINLPIGFGTSNDIAHPELKKVRSFFDYDDYFDEEKTRIAIAAYYGLVSFMDNCIGRILSALEKSGQSDNTVVIYVSDHGEMLGDQGFWTKQIMFEASAGIPMIMFGPGIPKNHQCSTPTSLLDIAATAFDNFDIPIAGRETLNLSKSLVKIASETDDMNRTVLSEYHDGGSTTGTFMIRWQKWKYIHYVGERPQLFDLDLDPDELTDLADGTTESLEITKALKEGAKRLRNICNPDQINIECFEDQSKKIETLGGEDACLNGFTFNHTPTPSLNGLT